MRLSAAQLCAVVLLAAAGLGSAQIPEADVGGLVLFPSRDFVTIEGFQAATAGKPFKTEVVRGATISADGTASGGTVVGAAWSTGSGGEVAAEVNHPGGECWGADAPNAPDGVTIPASLKVTPDIRANDVVRISDELGNVIAGHKVLDANITDIVSGPGLNFVVKGRIGPDVSRVNLEQRIINPDWTATSVGRRDARATISNGLVAADKGGYSSMLSVDQAGVFTATYEFADAQAHALAIEGGSRIMAWVREDADANRLGLTIVEDGELGGPGLGGCPNGPAAVEAPQGSFAAKKDANGLVTFSWSKPQSVPDASALTGYYMAAMDLPTSTQRVEYSKRVMDPAATTTTVSVPTTPAGRTFEYEMRSITESGAFSKPFAVLRTGAAPPAGGNPPDALSTTLNGNVVTLVGAGGLEAYYTTSVLKDDNPVALGGDTVSPKAERYKGPVTLDTTTEARWFHWIAFNAADLYTSGSELQTVKGAPPIDTAPTLQEATVGQETLTVKWTTTDTNIAFFDVQVWDSAEPAANAPAGVIVAEATKQAGTLRQLAMKAPAPTADKPGRYWVTVRGLNSAGTPGPWAVRYGGPAGTGYVTQAPTDKLTISAAGRYRAGRDFRADGTATDTSALLHLCRGPLTATGGCTRITQNFSATPGLAGATPAWTVRLTNNAANIAGGVNPLYVKSDKGGIAGPVNLAARRLRRSM